MTDCVQVLLGAMRWKEISCAGQGTPYRAQAFRDNMIGHVLQSTLPSTIGGDAVSLASQSQAGWKAAYVLSACR